MRKRHVSAPGFEAMFRRLAGKAKHRDGSREHMRDAAKQPSRTIEVGTDAVVRTDHLPEPTDDGFYERSHWVTARLMAKSQERNRIADDEEWE